MIPHSRRISLASLTLIVIAFASTAARADTTVLTEGFEGVAGGFYFTGTTVNQFTVQSASVEVLASNNENGRCTGAGGAPTCVNLFYQNTVNPPSNGTTFSSTDSFGPGTYNLFFDLAGSQIQNGLSNTTRLFFGSIVNAPIVRAANDPFSTVSFFNVTVAPGALSRITFFDQGVSGAGNLLDNVRLVRVDATAVPEPATMTLLITGLAGVAAKLRKRRKARTDEEGSTLR